MFVSLTVLFVELCFFECCHYCLDYEDSQGLECKRGLSRIPDYEG